MRRTIISGDNDDELGFLPGTLEEKIKGYNYGKIHLQCMWICI